MRRHTIRIKIGDMKKCISLFIILLFCFAVFLISIFLYAKRSNERMKQMEAENKIEENEDVKKENVPESGTSIISNLSAYASPVLGDKAELLEECLNSWLKENGMETTSGEIFYTIIPENDTECILFFLTLSSEEETVVILSYNKESGTVHASSCAYTREEVLAETWNGDVPSIRDFEEVDD